MILNEKQQQGLEIAVQRFKDGERYTVISGYAGSGKTTLVKFIIAALEGIDPEEDVVYTSFTGKATQVLASKGNKNTSTLHKLLYKSAVKPDGSYYRKPVLSIGYKIVVVDEISMVPMSLLKDLAKHDTHVLCLGDPGQLPPVYKNEDNMLLQNPHIFLDEIMRQAKESEIIQLTMKIRAGEKLIPFQGKEVQVITKEELNTGMYDWADQIIVATNETRQNLNNEIRKNAGRGPEPEVGDKIMCIKNDWDILSLKQEQGLTNGTIGYITDYNHTFVSIPFSYLRRQFNIDSVPLMSTTIETTEDDIYRCGIDYSLLTTGTKTLEWPLEYKLISKSETKGIVPKEFVYAYAITCHKSQGSQWDNVLVIEEKFPFNQEEHMRWLYTACTRAAKKLVLVLAQ